MRVGKAVNTDVYSITHDRFHISASRTSLVRLRDGSGSAGRGRWEWESVEREGTVCRRVELARGDSDGDATDSGRERRERAAPRPGPSVTS